MCRTLQRLAFMLYALAHFVPLPKSKRHASSNFPQIKMAYAFSEFSNTKMDSSLAG
jgi:hypothetical protein